MDNLNVNVREEIKSLFAEVGGVDSFSSAQAVLVMKKFIELLRNMGLNENSTGDFLAGYSKIFNMEFYNLPDFNAGKYVFAPNHVSEFDGPLFGILHPNMLVMAKKSWTDDPLLNAFLGQFFKIVGVDRNDKLSGAIGLVKCIEHINNSENSAVTIFVQQTIADIDLIQPEDIAAGALSVHKKTGASVIPVFCEQVSVDYPTRIVFGEPMEMTSTERFGFDWLDAELKMQKSLTQPSARKPLLNEKHSTPISQRGF